MNTGFHDWDGQTMSLYAEQHELASRVMLRDAYTTPLRTVAGIGVDVENDDATNETCIHASVVVLDAVTMDVLERQETRTSSLMPSDPDLLGFRAVPAMLNALGSLSQRPDLAFVVGHGIDHPRRLGSASHLGLAADLPCIGIGQDLLVGSSRLALHEMRGAFTPLRDGKEQVGWLLRSKVGVDPLIVSPGHRVSMASAPGLVMRYVCQHRLPEPLRLADHHAAFAD